MNIQADEHVHPDPALRTGVLGILAILLEHRWKIIGWTLGLGMLAVGATLVLAKPEFRASSMFHPVRAGGGAPSQLAGVAARFGIAVGGADGESLTYYAALIESRPVLERAAAQVFSYSEVVEDDTLARVGTLPDIYEIEGATAALRIARAARRLKGEITVTPDGGTGTVILQVVAQNPDLAEQINRRILDAVAEIHLENRRNQASAERRFVQERLAAAQRDLTEAENRLQAFLQRNRRYQDSPELAFEHGRLQRGVTLQQELFAALATAFEQARISEVRNTPMLSVIEPPEGSAEPASNSLFLRLLVGFFAGFLIALSSIFLKLYLARAREENPHDYRRLQAALQANGRRPSAGEAVSNVLPSGTSPGAVSAQRERSPAQGESV